MKDYHINIFSPFINSRRINDMRYVVAISLLLALSACGCTAEPGDSTSPGEYWDGCWSEAKSRRNNETIIFPKP